MCTVKWHYYIFGKLVVTNRPGKNPNISVKKRMINFCNKVRKFKSKLITKKHVYCFKISIRKNILSISIWNTFCNCDFNSAKETQNFHNIRIFFGFRNMPFLCWYYVTKLKLIKKMQAAFAPFATFSRSAGLTIIVVHYLVN